MKTMEQAVNKYSLGLTMGTIKKVCRSLKKCDTCPFVDMCVLGSREDFCPSVDMNKPYIDKAINRYLKGEKHE